MNESIFQARFHAREVFGLLTGANARKRRLFVCACVRRVWHLILIESVRHAVIVSEQHADGLANRKELRAALRTATAAFQAARSVELSPPTFWALRAASLSGREDWGDSWPSSVAEDVVEAICLEVAPGSSEDQGNRDAIESATLKQQIELVQDLLASSGPRPVPPPAAAIVTSLATALYDGEEAIAPLQDALLEAGQEKLARHFSTGSHPKGCWALDLILGKT